VFNWLWKRVFSDENIGFLMEKAEPYITDRMVDVAKDAMFKLLEDEEFNEWLTQMGDAYYNRYMQKFGGWIGGNQKGINYAIDREASQLNPLAAVMDEDGNFSLSKAMKSLMSGQFRQFIASPGSSPTSNGSQGVPKMKQLPS